MFCSYCNEVIIVGVDPFSLRPDKGISLHDFCVSKFYDKVENDISGPRITSI